LKAADLSLWTEGELYLYSTVSAFGDPSGWIRARPGASWWGVIEGQDVITLKRLQPIELNEAGWGQRGHHYVARDEKAWARMRAYFEREAERERERRDRERQASRKTQPRPSIYPDVDECRHMIQRYHPDRPDGDRDKFEKWQRLLDLAKEAEREDF